MTRGRARERRARREERRRCTPRQSTAAGGLRPAPVVFRAPVCRWHERQASRAASCRSYNKFDRVSGKIHNMKSSTLEWLTEEAEDNF